MVLLLDNSITDLKHINLGTGFDIKLSTNVSYSGILATTSSSNPPGAISSSEGGSEGDLECNPLNSGRSWE